MEIDQILKEVDTDPHKGLSENEVNIRLDKYGYNELKKEEKISLITLFFNASSARSARYS